MTLVSKSRIIGVLLIAILVMSLEPKPSQANVLHARATSSTDQIIVKYRNPGVKAVIATDTTQQTVEMAALSVMAGVRLTYYREMSGASHVLKLPRPMLESEVRRITNALMKLPDVEYAEPDSIMKATYVPNDPDWTNQWNYHGTFGINLAPALDIGDGSGGPVVAIIDSGVLLNHRDLTNCCVAGYDFVTDSFRANDGDGRDADPTDPGDWVTAADQMAHPGICTLDNVRDSEWHGTHVAGIVGANTNNNIDVAGVSHGSKLLPVRVLGRCGGTISDIADGMRWAAGLNVPGVTNNQNPARVLNLSLGGAGSCGSTFQDAINAVRNAGAVVVVAAGNDAMDASGFTPANCDGVITVAATDQSGDRSIWSTTQASNFGTTIEISAPGTGIWSTLNNGTTTANQDTTMAYNGTSMATPQVAGTAALVRTLRPQLTPDQVLEVLQDTVTSFPVGSTCDTSNCGSGIVNAGNAASDLYINRDYGGGGSFGSRRHPYNTLKAANDTVWYGAKLKMDPGEYNETLTLSKRMTLTSNGGIVVIGK